MLYRIFLAINIPLNIKKQLLNLKEKYYLIPASWAYEETIHITLSFLGSLDDNQLLESINKTKEIVSFHSCFNLKINQIIYGPPNKIPPRYIWGKIEKSKELSLLQSDLERNLFNLPSFEYKIKENRGYSPHITLARIKTFQLRNMEEDIPEINEQVNMIFRVDSVEIMQSFLKKKGPKHEILESIELKD